MSKRLFSLFLEQHHHDYLAAYSEQVGQTRAEIVRQLIDVLADLHPPEPTEEKKSL